MANYVNNKKFYTVLVEYLNACKRAERQDEEIPKIPDYIGECILLIATRLAKKPNFYNYTFKDDMISDGIENCFAYLKNFDPIKSENPFAYFTQIIYFAFLRRLEKEKKQIYIKHKYGNSLAPEATISHMKSSGGIMDLYLEETTNVNDIITTDGMDAYMEDVVDYFENRKPAKRKARKKLLEV